MDTDTPDKYPLGDEYINIHQNNDDDEDINIRPGNDDCTCIDYVNKNGVGNCQGKGEKRFHNVHVCYVSLPSNCPDLKISKTDANKFLSAVACNTNKKRNFHPNSVGSSWKPTDDAV